MTSKTILEITKRTFLRDVFAEFFGTMLFLYLITSVLAKPSSIPNTPNVVQISFCIGIAIAVLAQIFGPVSGAHLNPAVTMGVLMTGQLNAIRAVCYVIAQCIGAIVGSAITSGITTAGKENGGGVCSMPDGSSAIDGFFAEFFLTLLLVLTVLGSTDAKRNQSGFPPCLAIGLSIVVAHLAGIPYTGSGINPARVFGPAVVENNFPDYHWIYWIGPLLAGVVGGLLYRFVFSYEEPVERKSIASSEPLEECTYTAKL